MTERNHIMKPPRKNGHPLKDHESALQELRALRSAQADPRSLLWNEPIHAIRLALLGIGARIFQSPRFRGLECDPEHAVQDFFHRFLEVGIHRCQPGRPLYPYVYRIFVRICLTLGRKQRYRRVRPLDIDLADDRTNPVHQVERKQARIATRLAICKLSPDDRGLVNDRFYWGLTAREAGEKRGISAGAIDRRMSAIYRAMRKNLSPGAHRQAP